VVVDAGAGAAVESDEGFLRQQAQRQRRVLRVQRGQGGVVPTHHHRQRVAEQRLRCQRLGQGALADDAEVQPMVEQGIDLLQRVHFQQLQPHRRLLAEGEDRGGDLRRQRRGAGHADAQLAGFAALGAPGLFDRLVHLGEDGAGFGQEARPASVSSTRRLSRRNRHVHLALELADLLAQWRLRHAQPLGRAAEVQLVGDGDEIAQMAEFDRHAGSVGDTGSGPAWRRKRLPLGVAGFVIRSLLKRSGWISSTNARACGDRPCPCARSRRSCARGTSASASAPAAAAVGLVQAHRRHDRDAHAHRHVLLDHLPAAHFQRHGVGDARAGRSCPPAGR
jgi:hypothetical protein